MDKKREIDQRDGGERVGGDIWARERKKEDKEISHVEEYGEEKKKEKEKVKKLVVDWNRGILFRLVGPTLLSLPLDKNKIPHSL